MKLTEFQNKCMEAIADEQYIAVQNALCKYKNDDDIENILYDVTFDTIVRVMTLIDGYTNSGLKMDIINRETNESLRQNIELHDIIINFIRYEK